MNNALKIFISAVPVMALLSAGCVSEPYDSVSKCDNMYAGDIGMVNACKFGVNQALPMYNNVVGMNAGMLPDRQQAYLNSCMSSYSSLGGDAIVACQNGVNMMMSSVARRYNWNYSNGGYYSYGYVDPACIIVGCTMGIVRYSYAYNSPQIYIPSRRVNYWDDSSWYYRNRSVGGGTRGNGYTPAPAPRYGNSWGNPGTPYGGSSPAIPAPGGGSTWGNSGSRSPSTPPPSSGGSSWGNGSRSPSTPPPSSGGSSWGAGSGTRTPSTPPPSSGSSWGAGSGSKPSSRSSWGSSSRKP